MIIAVSGTPGSGKSTVSKLLAKELGYSLVELSKLLKNGYGKETEISIRRLNKVADVHMGDDTILVSHMAHLLTSKRIGIFIVLRCDPRILVKRLKRRGYGVQKIYDNVMFEALDGTYIEASELHRTVVQVDNTKNLTDTVKMLGRLVRGGQRPKRFAKDYSKEVLWIEKLRNKR